MAMSQKIVQVPENLKKLMEGDQTGYQLHTGYILELQHGLMGFFPAIFKTTKKIVVMLDLELLKKVAATLTPRPFTITSNIFQVNQKLGVAYPMLTNTEDSKPQVVLTDAELNRLTAEDSHPFEWAPGLIGSGMTKKEFLQTLEHAAKQHGVALAG
jgi:hypothetical protein